MKIVATICSKLKSADVEDVPARLRYIGENIPFVEKIAQEQHLPFYILSGKFGLLPADQPIPNYDYYLTPDAVEPISQTIAEQLRSTGITEIEFYREDKPTWQPYADALTKAADATGALVITHLLV